MDRLVDVDGTVAAAGIKVIAPGLNGRVKSLGKHLDLLTPGSELFHSTLANSGLTATAHIALVHSSPATDAVKIAVPAPTPGYGALLLVHDSTGALNWHTLDGVTPSSKVVRLPTTATVALVNEGTQESAPKVSFTVPARRFATGNEHAGLLSRLVGLVEHFRFHPSLEGASKLLSVVEYPVEHLLGKPGRYWFEKWENNKHPYVIRWFPQEGNLSAGEPLSPTNWHELAKGPTLLFIHGIFSNCKSGFAGIGDDKTTWPVLRDLYDNRIIGFDHPTASVSPADNAAWFLGQIPKVNLKLDIMCHSRGGLVARSIADQVPQWGEANGQKLGIDRIVFAATPNGGTQITVADHWVALVNRISSVLTLPAKILPAPADAISEILAGLLEVLKLVGVGVALDLPGLEDMCPDSECLKSLGQTASLPRPTYYAAAADFEPGPVLANLFNRLDDMGRVVDTEIFDHVHNDIAVPTDGVWDPANPNGLTPPPAAGAIPGFPIDVARRLNVGHGNVWHCGYFGDPAMRAKLLTWLRPEQGTRT
jgi:pimeloyl-ACP methyl ester carboxylesterase